jgi:hypothetical protein
MGERRTSRRQLTRKLTREENTQTDEGADITEQTVKAEKRKLRHYKRIIFVLGCVMGVVLAWAFRSPDLQLEGLLDSVDMADFFDDIKAALPSALPMGLVKEAREIQEHSRQSAAYGAFSIGEQLSREGLSAHHPVIMVSSIGLVARADCPGARCHLHRSRKLVHHKLLVSVLIFIHVI